jgi:hypothetical protein
VFLVDLSALRALQSVPLQIKCLIIGRDPSVANAHVANPKNSSRFWIVHFEMASATNSAMNGGCFRSLERCGENQGFWDAALTIETAVHMNAPRQLPAGSEAQLK